MIIKKKKYTKLNFNALTTFSKYKKLFLFISTFKNIIKLLKQNGYLQINFFFG